jgi:hypothetical protein
MPSFGKVKPALYQKHEVCKTAETQEINITNWRRELLRSEAELHFDSAVSNSWLPTPLLQKLLLSNRLSQEGELTFPIGTGTFVLLTFFAVPTRVKLDALSQRLLHRCVSPTLMMRSKLRLT